jgi:hypothetical protein
LLSVKDKWVDEAGDTMTGDLTMAGGKKINGTEIIGSREISNNTILNEDIAADANIWGSKIYYDPQYLRVNNNMLSLVTNLFKEIDPQVDDYMIDNYVPRWNDSKDMLVSSDIYYNPDNARVGIGTPSPGAKLDVNGNLVVNGRGRFNDELSAVYRITLQQSGYGTAGTKACEIIHNGSELKFRMGGDSGNVPINFSMFDTSALYINGNGNVGIGTTSPGSKLTVQTTGSQHAFVSMQTDGTAGMVAAATFQRGSGNNYWEIGSGVGLGDNEFGVYSRTAGSRVFTILSGGNVGIGTVAPAKLLTLSSSSAGNGSAIRLQTTGPGSYRWDLEGGNEYFKLYSADTPIITAHYNGSVGIGTSSLYPGAKLDVNGHAVTRGVHYLAYQDNRIQAVEGGGWPYLAFSAYGIFGINKYTTVLVPPQGGFCVTDYRNSKQNMWSNGDNGNLQISGNYGYISDDRIKVNKQKLDYGLAQIMALEPKRYDRVEYEYDPETEEIIIHPEKISRTNEIGLVAQDVQQFIPEAVTAPEDENSQLWSMSSDTIIPVLVKAIQEQQAQIEALKQEIHAIKSGN